MWNPGLDANNKEVDIISGIAIFVHIAEVVSETMQRRGMILLDMYCRR
jgi:hypothetical protein